MNSELILSVTDFVALLNQTLDFAYPSVTIIGEIANLKISKNRWVYFDLKDEFCSVKFFAVINQLLGPVEDGLIMQVRGVPKLHPQFGFSVNVQFMSPVGEGSIKKASSLLETKLRKEGLFDDSRKRTLPYCPEKIGLITSSESAAYGDFIKILDERWGGVSVELFDVQVQGEPAVEQIVNALEYFNSRPSPVDVLVITRGGGSIDDLAVFSSEQVTRAVAGSRITTLVAIGHEADLSLAELAADKRASTPSNAAQMIVPDKISELSIAAEKGRQINMLTNNLLEAMAEQLVKHTEKLDSTIKETLSQASTNLKNQSRLLYLLSPNAILKKGYAVVKTKSGKHIGNLKNVKLGQDIALQFLDGQAEARVTKLG